LKLGKENLMSYTDVIKEIKEDDESIDEK